jgi:hypothetical protein
LIYIDILTYFALGFAFIPAVAAALFFKKQQKALKILSAFVIFNGVTEIVNSTVVLNNINSLPIHHFYTVVEFSVSLIISSLVIYPNAKSPYRFLSIIALVLLISILDVSFFESLKSVNSIPRVIQGLTMIAISIYFFYKIFIASEFIDILRYPYFWLYTGWLIYFSGTFFLFVYSYQTGMTITYPIIHSVLYIFLNLVYTYVLWLGSRKSTS